MTGAHADGKYLTVEATYTNNNDAPLYAWCSFVFCIGGIPGRCVIGGCLRYKRTEVSIIKAVKDEAFVDVSYKFELDNKDDEIIAATPTADVDVLAEVYLDGFG